jgi:invasion protein IalB
MNRKDLPLRPLSVWACATLTISLASPPAFSATIVNTYSDWTLYANEDGAGKVCFLAALPAQTQPPGITRGQALAYVSAWPKDGVKSEISFKLGFVLKKATEPTASTIGPGASSYRLFVKDDRAYVADATQELKLLEALRKGSKLTIQAISVDDTSVTDTYALQGITAALQALAGGCP